MVMRVGDLGFQSYAPSSSFAPRERVSYPEFFPEQFVYPKSKKEKVGFWEGLKTIAKGFVKPLKELVKHPLKSAAFIGIAAALVIGTGGAATPFLIAAGIGIGTFQIGKGIIGAAMSDNREETLANLEDIGSGGFAVATSAFGARTYMAGTAGGSATVATSQQVGFWAKAGAFTKGLAQDSWSVLKMAPNSLKTSLAMFKSGEFVGNIQSAIASTKLAAMRRNVAQARINNQDNYQQLLAEYKLAKQQFDSTMLDKKYAVYDKYVEMAGKSKSPVIEQNAMDLSENGFFKVPSRRFLINKINPLKNNTTENMALALNGVYDTSEEQIEEMMPYAEMALGA